MTILPSRKQLRRAAWAGMLALLTLMAYGVGSASAQNQESTSAKTDEADSIENHVLNTDKKIFNSIMGVLGLAPSDGETITYRERSPLVVPPQRDLPPPERNALAKNPEWPVDPEVKLRKEEASALKNASQIDPSKPLAGSSAIGPKVATGSRGTVGPGGNDDPTATTKKPESLLNIFNKGKLWGSPLEEVGTFAGEPPRNSLTEPPPGYLTPSPTEPYGVTKREFERPKAEKPL